jgi:thioredoxin reductase
VTIVTAIPGAEELVGKGVYRGMPKDIPQPVRDRNAMVVGEAVECATAARQLTKGGWRVTVVTRGRCGCRVGRECRRRLGTEVVCATGGEYLEAVVLRRIDTGRVDACNASALFVL